MFFRNILLNLKIKKFVLVYEIIFLFFLLLSMFSVAQLYQETSEVSLLEYNRFELASVSEELRQSSNELTRVAQYYVVTGDSKFKEAYLAILKARNASSPQVASYHHVDWDLLPSINSQENIDQNDNFFHERIGQLPFNDYEKGKLRESEYHSSELIRIEQRAFYALEGVFQDKLGEFTLKGQADPALATQLLHSDTYLNVKEKVVKPISEFMESISRRTQQQIDSHRDIEEQLFRRLGVIAAFCFMLLLLVFYLTSVKVLDPVEYLMKSMLDYQNNHTLGDVDSEKEARHFFKDEVGQMARQYYAMKKKVDEDFRVLENLAQSNSRFLANMSHEIRTPLNAILGYIKLLRKHKVQQDPEILKAYLDIIDTSGEHLLIIINEVLDMSKINEGKVEFFHETFDFHELLQQTYAMLKMNTDMKELEFHYYLDKRVPQFVVADAAKVKQILLNLLSNATKFTEAGSISMDIRIDLSSTDNLKVVPTIITVSDTGIGVAEDKLESIFNIFEQTIDGASAGGSGLGLPISRNLAQLMGGDIVATQNSGPGTTFTLTLPLEVADAVVAEISPQPDLVLPALLDKSSCDRKTRILIVDDLDLNRQLLSLLLEEFELDLQEAEDGVEALKTAKEWKPDLILMDAIMPNMDGVAATREILAVPGLQATPIVFLTASTIEDERSSFVSAGAVEVINKPVQEQELFEVIERHTNFVFKL